MGTFYFFEMTATVAPPPTPPAAPTLFTPTADCPGKVPSIHLDWSDSPGVSRYDLYRNGFFYINTSTDSYFLNNANVTFGNAYSYYVRAVGSNGLTSDPSNSQSIQATCQVKVSNGGIGLNLRICAGISCSVITLMPEGTTMTIIGGPVQVDGFTWYNITGLSGTGWSSGGGLSP